MPDMPQGNAPMPPAAAAAPPQAPGGGLADAIVQVEAALNKITDAITNDPKAPDDVKQAFSSALDAFHGAAQALAGGGADDGSGDSGESDTGMAPPQGGAEGVPMTHQNMRG